MSNDDMKLPDGKSCRDCTAFRRCRALFGCKPHYTTCDFAPSRFHERDKSLDEIAELHREF